MHYFKEDIIFRILYHWRYKNSEWLEIMMTEVKWKGEKRMEVNENWNKLIETIRI